VNWWLGKKKRNFQDQNLFDAFVIEKNITRPDYYLVINAPEEVLLSRIESHITVWLSQNTLGVDNARLIAPNYSRPTF
jgi:hypothetical protein